jgi:hypothetical protein
MRIYKPAFGTSLLYAYAHMFLCCGSMLFVLAVAMAIEGSATFWEVFLGSMSAMAAVLVLAAVILKLISLLIGLFVRKTVELTESTITYQGKTIPLEKVRHITLYLPVLSKHNSKPPILTLWADNTTYMDIKRPAPALILALKKSCVFAAFDVDDWKDALKQCLWIQLGIVAFAIVAIIFGFE